MQLTSTQRECLDAIVELETDGEIKSLFQVASLVVMDYAWSWHVLNSLEAADMVKVERNGRGVPLRICSTETGRRALAESRGEPVEAVFSLAD